MAYPQITDYRTGSLNTNGTSSSIIVPDNTTSGDLLVLFITKDGTNTFTTTPTDWTLLDQKAYGGQCHAIFYRQLTGSISNFTITHVSEQTTWVIVRIPSGSVPVINTVATGSSTTPNPTSLTSGFAANTETLYLASAGWDYNRTASGFPSNMSLYRYSSVGTTTGGCGTAIAGVESTAASFDPSNFTMGASDTWCAYTIAISYAFDPNATVIQDTVATATAETPNPLQDYIAILRKTAAGGTYALHAFITDINATEYTDCADLEDDEEYYYKVAIVQNGAIVGNYSNEAHVVYSAGVDPDITIDVVLSLATAEAQNSIVKTDVFLTATLSESNAVLYSPTVKIENNKALNATTYSTVDTRHQTNKFARAYINILLLIEMLIISIMINNLSIVIKKINLINLIKQTTKKIFNFLTKNLDGWTIQRKDGEAGDFVTIAEVPLSITSYTDCYNLQNGTTYYYRIRRSFVNFSDWSNIQSFEYITSGSTTDKNLSNTLKIIFTNKTIEVEKDLLNEIELHDILIKQSSLNRLTNIKLSNILIKQVNKLIQNTIKLINIFIQVINKNLINTNKTINQNLKLINNFVQGSINIFGSLDKLKFLSKNLINVTKIYSNSLKLNYKNLINAIKISIILTKVNLFFKNLISIIKIYSNNLKVLLKELISSIKFIIITIIDINKNLILNSKIFVLQNKLTNKITINNIKILLIKQWETNKIFIHLIKIFLSFSKILIFSKLLISNIKLTIVNIKVILLEKINILLSFIELNKIKVILREYLSNIKLNNNLIKNNILYRMSNIKLVITSIKNIYINKINIIKIINNRIININKNLLQIIINFSFINKIRVALKTFIANININFSYLKNININLNSNINSFVNKILLINKDINYNLKIIIIKIFNVIKNLNNNIIVNIIKNINLTKLLIIKNNVLNILFKDINFSIIKFINIFNNRIFTIWKVLEINLKLNNLFENIKTYLINLQHLLILSNQKTFILFKNIINNINILILDQLRLIYKLINNTIKTINLLNKNIFIIFNNQIEVFGFSFEIRAKELISKIKLSNSLFRQFIEKIGLIWQLIVTKVTKQSQPGCYDQKQSQIVYYNLTQSQPGYYNPKTTLIVNFSIIQTIKAVLQLGLCVAENLMMVEGETQIFELKVIDTLGEPVLLTGATAKFGISTRQKIVKDCVVDGDTVYVKLDPVDTIGKFGKFQYEFKIREANTDVDSLILGEIEIKKAVVLIEEE